MTTPTPKRVNLLTKVVLPMVVILAIAVGALSVLKSQLGKNAPETGTTSAKSGGAIPDFEIHPLNGSPKKLSDLKAKVVLVNFWATWCEACIVEMPSIVELRRAYKDKGFEVVAVNVDEKPEAVVPKAIQQLKIDFPVYTDPDQKLAELFDVHAIPLTVILDAERNVLMAHNGELNWNSDQVRSKVEGWLAK